MAIELSCSRARDHNRAHSRRKRSGADVVLVAPVFEVETYEALARLRAGSSGRVYSLLELFRVACLFKAIEGAGSTATPSKPRSPVASVLTVTERSRGGRYHCMAERQQYTEDIEGALYDPETGENELAKGAGLLVSGRSQGRGSSRTSSTRGSRFKSSSRRLGGWRRRLHVARQEGDGHGAPFEHYDFPGMTLQGDLHIAGDMKVAWFKDPTATSTL